MNNTKKQTSIRLSPAALTLVESAAEESGLSVGEVIESCVVNQARNVAAAIQEEQKFLASPEARGNVIAAARKRPRDERSDKGQKRPVLPKDHMS